VLNFQVLKFRGVVAFKFNFKLIAFSKFKLVEVPINVV
jgi:hypothetical protein